MLPESKASAIDALQNTFGETGSVIGLKIIDFLSLNLSAKNIPLVRFFELTAAATDSEKNSILAIVSALCGPEFLLLDIFFEYVDENDQIFVLDRGQAKAAFDKNINPLTGDVDLTIRDKLFLCFSPSDHAKKTLGAAI